MSNERCISTNIGGNIYQIASDDDYLDAIKGDFEPAMVMLFDCLIEADDIVLDVGANIGCTSILFGIRAKQVISFEPSPSTFRYLVKNIQEAQLDNIQTVNSGLGKTTGKFELTFAANNRSGGFVSDQMNASEGHQVESIDIINGDDFLSVRAISHVDFIKIDVEGFERNVIEGLTVTLARDKPIVALELNHWCLNVFQRTSVPDFFDFLRGVFPYLYAVDSGSIRNLRNNNEAYEVMYQHIIGGFKYPNLVGAFNKQQLGKLAATFGRQIDD